MAHVECNISLRVVRDEGSSQVFDATVKTRTRVVALT